MAGVHSPETCFSLRKKCWWERHLSALICSNRNHTLTVSWCFLPRSYETAVWDYLTGYSDIEMIVHMMFHAEKLTVAGKYKPLSVRLVICCLFYQSHLSGWYTVIEQAQSFAVRLEKETISKYEALKGHVKWHVVCHILLLWFESWINQLQCIVQRLPRRPVFFSLVASFGVMEHPAEIVTFHHPCVSKAPPPEGYVL